MVAKKVNVKFVFVLYKIIVDIIKGTSIPDKHIFLFAAKIASKCIKCNIKLKLVAKYKIVLYKHKVKVLKIKSSFFKIKSIKNFKSLYLQKLLQPITIGKR